MSVTPDYVTEENKEDIILCSPHFFQLGYNARSDPVTDSVNVSKQDQNVLRKL